MKLSLTEIDELGKLIEDDLKFVFPAEYTGGGHKPDDQAYLTFKSSLGLDWTKKAMLFTVCTRHGLWFGYVRGDDFQLVQAKEG